MGAFEHDIFVILFSNLFCRLNILMCANVRICTQTGDWWCLDMMYVYTGWCTFNIYPESRL